MSKKSESKHQLSLFDHGDHALRRDRRGEEAGAPSSGRQSGDLRHRGRRRARHLAVAALGLPRPGRLAVLFRPDRSVALVHRAVRHFRRSGGRGARQGPGGDPARHPQRHARPSGCSTRTGAVISPRSIRPSRRPICNVGDIVLVEAGDLIPSDGDIIEGVASVNESAITGESAPVIREAGGDRCAVTGGTTVLSDWIKVRITAQPGNTFIDRMIALVEGAERQKTPNELALSVLLAGLTIMFLIAVVTLWSFAKYSSATVSVTVLVALAGDADSDHHRRPALGHRDRRHGPAGPLQRAGHLGPRRRGGGRRRHSAARQDRHHHLRQSHGQRIHRAAGRRDRAGWRRPR